ncbi:MAG: nuclear transport factor 2 family protein [Sphingomonas sp.]
MPRFTEANAVSALEVQQLIIDWGYELDLAGGAGIARFCTEDCNYLVGGTPYRSHAAITAFYAARNERVRTQQRDGIRTQRHTISNIRLAFPDADHAAADFILVNYSAEGPAPARDLVGPTIIADCRMEFACGQDGEWRIALFDSTPVFIGNDPFLNAAVVRT